MAEEDRKTSTMRELEERHQQRMKELYEEGDFERSLLTPSEFVERRRRERGT